MGNRYMQYPGTVKALATEMLTVCDDYYDKKINNDEMKDVIKWYAINQRDKFFSEGALNPTVTKILGKKRVNLVNTVLDEIGGV